MKLQKWLFQYRIFVSFAIVATVAVLIFKVLPPASALTITAGTLLGLSVPAAWFAGCSIAIFLLGMASLLRIWGGGVLTARRMMAFPVQTDAFVAIGPYRLMRNPIYLADVLAMSAFALLLPPTGTLLPLLFIIHYQGLICYEEKNLERAFRTGYAIYCWKVPRWLPSFKSLCQLKSASVRGEFTCTGWPYNGLYLLFLPGFALTAWTHHLWHGLLLGLPAVVAWAVVHTRLGMNEGHTGGKRCRTPKVMRDILYAQCWEDPLIDRLAFDIGEDDVVFCITSGGCNALAFLLDNPQKLIALDLNPFQTCLLDLKICAFSKLEYGELLELIGVRDSVRRLQLYWKLRPALKPESRKYWDNEEQKLVAGIIHCGRFEAYLRLLRRVMRLLIGRNAIAALYDAHTPMERLHVYRRHWCTLRWRFCTRILLCRSLMSLLFDKAFFEQLDASFSFGAHFEKKIQRALLKLPLRENWFLSYMLLGRYFDEQHLPPYLRHEYFEIIRSRLNRVEFVTADCADYFSRLENHSVSRFNFTNIFEWMSPEAFESLLRETIRVSRPGAVLTYRNLLVKREHPSALEDSIHSERTFAQWLHDRDLSFIYNQYVVELIEKEPMACPVTSKSCMAAL